jgi:GNAT superfamily N-acetyltransferase
LGRVVEVTINYLEQCERPRFAPASLASGRFAIMRVEEPPVSFYRYLYNLVGEPYFWVSRRRLSDPQIEEIIRDPKVHILSLYVAGAPLGFAELDLRQPETAELKFFGIAPQIQGRGLGRYFLTHALDYAWALQPTKLRLETCTLDHPAALPLYQKLGFKVFDQKRGEVVIPESGSK